PLSFVIIYETGHVAVHAREDCAYEGQYQFEISDDAVSDLIDCIYESEFKSLRHTYLGPKDSLAATSLGFCVGTNQQWVYAYTNTPPNAFTTVDDAVRSASRIDLFETGDYETITSTLTSGRPAPALSLLAQNTDLIEELPHEAVLAGIETGIQSDLDRTKYTALEVLSNVQSTVPNRLWEAVCTIESDHPDLTQKVTSTTTVVAATKPELVDDLAASLLETLRTDDPRRRTAALESLKSVSEHQPRVLIDALPAIETILKDGRTSDQRTALDAVLSLAKAEPEHVEPLASTLLTFIEDRTLPIRSSAIVGHLAKARPDVAVPAIETFGAWLDAEESRIRANGFAILADLAGTYPERLRRYVPRAREFLLDDDELVKYNATSILARVATVDPDAVEPATDSLRDALSVDHPPTQQNACWALGRIGAHKARSEIQALRERTDVQDVRAAATAGVVLLSLSECPRCGERIKPHLVSVAVDENMQAHWECPVCNSSTVVTPK
ncbi:HEAT repeat domain-containing protein, partial [Halobacterium salinarum]|uniref:HEAT repeat domain-containing protein n=1 Tax=Halobacterium salinarum TaxID=2242 RepID=UPI002555032C